MKSYDNQSQDMKNMFGDLDSEQEPRTYNLGDDVSVLHKRIVDLEERLDEVERIAKGAMRTASTLANGGSF